MNKNIVRKKPIKYSAQTLSYYHQFYLILIGSFQHDQSLIDSKFPKCDLRLVLDRSIKTQIRTGIRRGNKYVCNNFIPTFTEKYTQYVL